MTNEEYIETQNKIIALSLEIIDLPLAEFIAAAEKADVIGPILDPTLWRQAHDGLATLLDLAKGLRNFQKKVTHIQNEHLGEPGED